MPRSSRAWIVLALYASACAAWAACAPALSDAAPPAAATTPPVPPAALPSPASAPAAAPLPSPASAPAAAPLPSPASAPAAAALPSPASAPAAAPLSPSLGLATSPAVAVSIDERFYQVEGTTPWDLNRALRRNGPREERRQGEGSAERSWFGETDFTLRYHYDATPDEGGCHAAGARVEVELVTTLPEWPDRDAAPVPLQRDWDLFLNRLREHERGHQRIAIDLGQRLFSGVEALRAPDCDALRTEAQRLAQAFRTAGDLEHRSWDQQTAHGLVASGDGG